jgi:phosphoribosylamine--glycine ligase
MHPHKGQAAVSNVRTREGDLDTLVDLARREHVGLTVVGPEAPLQAGIVDTFRRAGLCVFGPTRAAAELEWSKAFAKAFMDRHHIPTARWAAFRKLGPALAHLAAVDYPVVVKASGLAAGKGVIVPADPAEAVLAVKRVLAERAFGAAGEEVVIEERLFGQEVTVLAFADGERVVPMPPSQDHKPVWDGDRGPNTGGMGAYAPAPILPPDQLAEVVRTVLEPTVLGMRDEGRPFRGVLYAGLMMTADGPRVLEYNVRFGDPEAQVVLPLLASDLVDVLQACAEGDLPGALPHWRTGAAATVVAASEGYPGPYETGRRVEGIGMAETVTGVSVFHAGTRRSEEGWTLTAGGRVLNVTAVADDLRSAVDRAYRAIQHVHFEGLHYRSDIGAKALS